jgi:hypothetical protein
MAAAASQSAGAAGQYVVSSYLLSLEAKKISGFWE